MSNPMRKRVLCLIALALLAISLPLWSADSAPADNRPMDAAESSQPSESNQPAVDSAEPSNEPSNEPVATPEAPTVENSPTTANNPPMDFKPSEEISEDFPISLPSDI